MKTNEIRRIFLNYFKEHDHAIVPSSSLVPANDPTLLFTNAGMVQFKDVFLGREKRAYSCATSSQRCVRAGGKHNDLENVGFTARHHTFFEMLGNFSFGDYFKREAIHFAWDFLTHILKIPTGKLWITVYEKDDEAADIWIKEIGVDPKHFSRCGEKDNFWSMGDTGPCGPSSEIFYDHGPEIDGGPPGTPEAEGDRYVEIWNLVFMQYNRDSKGTLIPLPKPSVDTGMGLERIAAIMQGVHSNYDIDLFQHLMKVAVKLTKCHDHNDPSLKVIADHIRACAFLIVDGVIPSNEGRGYVLRRIMRRAIRHGNKLGIKNPFFYKLVQPLIDVMGEAYPELTKAKKIVESVILQEEEQFAKTIQQGLKILANAITELDSDIIPGEIVFKLYDTYGFPADLTEIIAQEHGISIDKKGFDREMEKQREQSQASSHFKVEYGVDLKIDQVTEFTGYESLAEKAEVMVLFHDGNPVEKLHPEEHGVIVLNRTPFYAESGGQAGDIGDMRLKDGLFLVKDTQKIGGAYLHSGVLKSGAVRIGDKVEAQINVPLRKATALNHSATHLLHSALQQVLGDHVEQKGSSVTPYHLRFDFSHFKQVTNEELRLVEDIVNEKIRENLVVTTEIMSLSEAKTHGAMALFGEKYGEKVRVLKMGDFSIELCGGTHVNRTGDIGLFKFIVEEGIAAGVRRIEGLTGEGALQFIRFEGDTLKNACNILKTDKNKIIKQLEKIVQSDRDLKKFVSELKSQLAIQNVDELIAHARKLHGVQLIVARQEGVDTQGLRAMVDHIKDKLKKAVIVLAAVQEDETVNLVVGVTKSCVDRFNAGNIVKMIAEQIGGSGGGRPDLAQGAGVDIILLDKALNSVDNYLKNI